MTNTKKSNLVSEEKRKLERALGIEVPTPETGMYTYKVETGMGTMLPKMPEKFFEYFEENKNIFESTIRGKKLLVALGEYESGITKEIFANAAENYTDEQRTCDGWQAILLDILNAKAPFIGCDIHYHDNSDVERLQPVLYFKYRLGDDCINFLRRVSSWFEGECRKLGCSTYGKTYAVFRDTLWWEQVESCQYNLEPNTNEIEYANPKELIPAEEEFDFLK